MLSVSLSESPVAYTFDISTRGAVQVHRNHCRKVNVFWRDLYRRLRSTRTRAPSDKRSLYVPVTLQVDGVTFTARALVDTGASFPVILSKGLIPEHLLKNCSSPVRLVDASGASMTGGGRGASVELTLPVVSTTSGGIQSLSCSLLRYWQWRSIYRV